jgi:hypothetical protein
MSIFYFTEEISIKAPKFHSGLSPNCGACRLIYLSKHKDQIKDAKNNLQLGVQREASCFDMQRLQRLQASV